MTKRFLAIAAHPDDLDFGCAGTTATLTAAGDEVVYCIVTNGQAGGDDPSVSRDDMAALRQAEQTAAAAVVGVTEIHWLNFPDGAVEANLDLRREISRVIRIVKPDVVLTQSPIRNLDRIYSAHPDHLATGEAAMCAVYPDARNMFAFPELLDAGYEPRSVPETWIIGGPDPDHFIDITDQIDTKVDALLCHTSQISDPDRMRKLMPEWAADVAKRGDLAEGRLAEGFRKVNTA
ncbi:MAG: PIG-L deacetylase family protein [Acidimicrobiales bacterium]